MPTDTTDKQRELLRLQAGEVRVYAPPDWLTRRFAIWALIGTFTLGPAVAALFFTAVDQWVRNTIDDRMSDPDMYKSVSLKPEEFSRLPLHWRQALAEISVRSETAELAEVRELMKTLTPEQTELIDRIAPYVTDGMLVRDSDNSSNHSIPGLSLINFATLEELGILQNIQRGLRITEIPLDRPTVLTGTTAALKILSGTSTCQNPPRSP